MKVFSRIIILSLLCVGCLATAVSAQIMSTYSYKPPVIAESARPNTMILLSNDWTGFTKGYKSDNVYDDSEDYWGYFDTDKYYEWNSPKGPFEPVGPVVPGTHYIPSSAGNNYWSGNFLNWATMSNVDFMRKALTGGAREADSVGGLTTLLRGNIASGRAWKKQYGGANLNRLVPSAYANANYEFYNTGETMTVRNATNGNTIAGPFTVEVTVCVIGMLEENCRSYMSGTSAKPEGLLHQYADKMNFALMTYSHAMPDEGGVLRKQMGDVSDEWSSTNGQQNQGSNDTMIRYIENYTEKGWDPLAEMFFDAVRYFKGNKGASNAYCDSGNFAADDGFNVYGCESNKDWGADPIVDWCQKNNIIIMNDEYPSREHNSLPGSDHNTGYSVTPAFAGADDKPYNIDVSYWTKVVGDWEKSHNSTSSDWYVGKVLGGVEDANCTNPKTVNDLSLAYGICPTEPGGTGTFYLAGIAHHAFTHDLRGETGLDGTQNIKTWTLAYRATSAATYNPPLPPMNQMWMAAKYGNFDDLNGNGKPDDSPVNEWADPDRTDAAGNPYPYAYYPADNGKQLVDAIGQIFDSILETTASSTAVSVLANSGQGEGNLVQAYYRPRVSLGEASVDWVGFLQSLWIDEFGFIREDTINDNVLNKAQDKVVRYVESGGTTKAWIYDVDAINKYPDMAVDTPTEVELEEVKVLWDAGQVLSETSPSSRKLFTYIDKNKDGLVEERLATTPDTDVFNDDGEVIQFYDRNYRALMPYLNVNDVLEGYLGRSQKIRALNLVRWTQGYDPKINANRFVDINNVEVRSRSLDGTDVYKLGDIINSTPVTISAPPDNYHIIYSDESYQSFFDKYKNRETVVYTGANDGMMHAFTAWRFVKTSSSFVDPDPLTNEPIGSELWAYIPQNLLPHLKWLPRQDYTHVYYVDMQPRVFDARVFADEFNDASGKHPKGWGTILVGGYGIGGGEIRVTDRFDDGSNPTGSNYVTEERIFNPSYFAIDITDPREPELLWDRTYEGMRMSNSFPTIMRVDNGTDDKGVWAVVFGSGPDDGSGAMGVPQYDGESGDPANFYMVDVLTGDPYQSNDGTDDHDYLFQTTEDNAFFGPPVSFDRNLNYNVDSAYLPLTYDLGTSASHDWKGAIYKVTVPWKGTFTDTSDANTTVDAYEMSNQYGNLGIAKYSSNPTDTASSGQYAWKFHKLFDSPRPITAAPSLSIDHLNNTWIYFGTGRMFSAGDDPNSDFGSEDVEYLYGIKDPFFNQDYYGTSPAYYFDYSNSLILDDDMTKTTPDLFDADPYIVLSTGQVYTQTGTSTYAKTYDYFDEMVEDAREFNGWRRTLRHVVEGSQIRPMRSLNKPSVIGGLSLFSTFMPTGDSCAFGGTSDLNILYYETGTAYKRAVARGSAGINLVDVTGDGTDEKQINDAISLGAGTTSSVGIHIGRQNSRASASGDDPEGDMVTGFVQQGTGQVVEIDIETALKVRSGLRAWRER